VCIRAHLWLKLVFQDAAQDGVAIAEGKRRALPVVQVRTYSSSSRDQSLETVLVLEDEPLAMRVICAALQPKGYQVLKAVTRTDAISAERRRGRRLDLLIADVRLPDGSGVHAAVELYEAFPEMAVLFVSGTPFEGWAPEDLVTLQVLPRSVWEFLHKPFRASTLQYYVSELLDRSAARSEAVVACSTTAGRASHYLANASNVLDIVSESAVKRPTMERLLRFVAAGNDAMTIPNPFENALNERHSPGRKIPDFVFCPEKIGLTEKFVRAIQELTELHAEQTRAVIDDDPDFSRFDVLIHMAAERKEQAKYALIRHMEAHHCEEGWNRWQ